MEPLSRLPVYECFCTRAEIQEASSAAHGPVGAYPGTCLSLTEDERALRRAAGRAPALRVRTGGPVVSFADRVLGASSGFVDDFVVRRNDGAFAYNLAVVVDDADQGIEEVVRGADLLETTPRQVWLAQNKVKDSDLDESSPDHLGSSLEVADVGPLDSSPRVPAVSQQAPKPSAAQGGVVPAALRAKETAPQAPSAVSLPANITDSAKSASNETVVLDVEQGGIEVPSFIGKSVRNALELAEDSGLELNLVGSGIAREQSPAPGSHVTAGSRVVVKFGR